MAVSLPLDFGFLVGGKSHPDQCQDACDTERRVSADINSCDPGSLCFREPATLEMANSIGRHCALLDKYGYAVVTEYR
jgi:hypothetical protein